jgi:putative drug exporter of the RND superfamily
MSAWAIAHPKAAITAWFLILLVALGAGRALGGSMVDSFALPGTPSQQAQDLLEKLGTPGSDPTTSLTVVWSPTSGKATDSDVRKKIMPMLEELSQQPHVTCVQTPFEKNIGTTCPSPMTTSLPDAVTAGISSILVKETGLSLRDVQDAARILAPLAQIAPNRLGTFARSLPTAATIARLPAPVLDGLVKAGTWLAGVIPGVTKAEADELSGVLGGLQKFAELPESVLASLSQADPQRLAALAEALPREVAEFERLDAVMMQEITRLRSAAEVVEQAISPVSADGTVAFATVSVNEGSLSAKQADEVASLLRSYTTAELRIGAQGAGIEAAGSGQDNSIPVGLAAAIIILLIAFGSVIAAFLPIMSAGTGLAAGAGLTLLAARGMDISTVAPSLAIMIGLGVGIDYALFVLNRYRQGLQDGVAPKDAALTAVRTAGRAVHFAGFTVIVALLGMFLLGINFFNGLAVAAALTVAMVMLAATWFLPAVLSLLGTKAIALRLPWARTLKPFNPQLSRWNSFGALLQRAPIIPITVVIAIIAILALPALQMKSGFPDDGSQPADSAARIGYDLMAQGFGEGRGGPFVVAVEVPKDKEFPGLKAALEALEKTPGVASTMPSSRMLPLLELDPKIFADNGRLTAVVVYPQTAPDAQATQELLTTLRQTTVPQVQREHNVQMFIGGTQAVSMDFTAKVQSALPLFLVFVIGFGFIALMVLFRSLVIPLTAAVTSLLSFAGALGVTVAVFQLGIGDSLLGVSGTGPILPFLPLMVFAILFGLSMDYQVFLVSRMREAWEQNPDNKAAVRMGLAGSGRVVVVAASIMTSVFIAFVLSPNSTLKLFGVALAAAVLIDAFLVRLILVPSVMSLVGKANWWLPRWLGKALPKVSID